MNEALKLFAEYDAAVSKTGCDSAHHHGVMALISAGADNHAASAMLTEMRRAAFLAGWLAALDVTPSAYRMTP